MDLSSSGSWSRGGLVGRQIGPYQVVDEIARGGQGVVLSVRHVELGYPAALKLLTVVTPQGTARFAQEAQLLALLQHPHIPRLRDHGLMNGVPFIALELVDGPTLKHALGQGLVTREQAVEVIEIVADTLEYCHTRGVVHRDLKPSNIVIGEGLTPRLLDFGLAKGEQDQSLSMTGEVVGTPGFMAPEQCGGEVSERADPRTDVYGLGALLYFALCGVPPHDGASIVNVIKKILEADPVHPREYAPDTPPALSDLCLRALAKDPVDRPGSAEEFASALAAWREAPVEISESGRGLVGILAVLILVGAIGLGVAMASRLSGDGVRVETAKTTSPTATAAPTPAATPTAAPTPRPVAEVRPRGKPVSDDHYKIRWVADAPPRKRPEVRAVGPWVLAQHGQGWWALRARDGERVALPPGEAFAWDAAAKRFVFRVKDRLATWDPERGGVPVDGVTIAQASGITVAGGVVVVNTLDRKLVGVVGSKVRWSVEVSGRLDAPPAALDIDGDGGADHLLLATAQGGVALRSLVDGGVVRRARVVGPVRDTPFVLEGRTPGGSVPVVVVCVDGHVARLDVGLSSISVRRVVVLHHPVQTPPVLVRRAGRAYGVAIGLGRWGVAAVAVDGSEVAWAEPPPQPGAWATQVAAIDLDEDGQDEVAVTWTVARKDTCLTIHASDGERLELLAGGAQAWGGVAAAERVLVAARRGGVEAWGWRKRWVRRTRTPSKERARFLLVSGAWTAAAEEAKGFPGAVRKVYTGLARVGAEGQRAYMQLMQSDPLVLDAEMGGVIHSAGTGMARMLAIQRFRGSMMGPGGPLGMELLPGSAVETELLPGDPAAPELQIDKTGIKSRGFKTVGIATAQGRHGRSCFVNGGWVGVRLLVATPGRYRLWLRHATVRSYGWGFSVVGVELNDERVLNAWSAPIKPMWDAVELPRLEAGEQKIRVRVLLRTRTFYTLSGLRLERIP